MKRSVTPPFLSKRSCIQGLFATLLFVFCLTAVTAQPWQLKHDGINRSDIHMISTLEGWSVGNFGLIAKTINGGVSWQLQRSGTSSNLLSVHFVSTTTGWAVGEGGLVLKTTDGGINWITLAEGLDPRALRDVFFINETHGWLTGQDGLLMVTADGGASWTYGNSAGWNMWLLDIYFISTTTGWAVGEGGLVLKTTDGGINWFNLSDGTDPDWLESVVFVDENRGWAVGDNGLVMSTSDGGLSWNSRYLPGNPWLTSISFLDNQKGWAAGWDGTIFSTSDGGANWTPQVSGTILNLHSIQFTSQLRGYAVGMSGTVLTTTDGGVTWQEYPSTHDPNLFSCIQFADASTGWMMGAGGLIQKTTNGGNTWTIQDPGSGFPFSALKVFSASTVLALSDRAILRTTDGGASWPVVYNHLPSARLWDMHFADAQNGWVVGEAGTILATTDGGLTWAAQASGTSSILRDVFFLDAATGWAVGENGIILKTTNGGSSWTRNSPLDFITFESVYFIDAQTGFVVGQNGTIRKTTDGGASWTNHFSGTGEHLWDVAFYDAQRGWAVGQNGSLHYTADGGDTWNHERLFGGNLLGLTIQGTSVYVTGTGSLVIKQDIPIVLPLTWGEFTGKSEGTAHRLHWQTLEETHTRFFVIERSHNGTTFEPIGEVAARRSSFGGSYQYVDHEPLRGVNFYRLQSVDNNGHSHYSKTIALSLPQNDAARFRVVASHMGSGNLQVQLVENARAGFALQLLSLDGRLLHKQQTTGYELLLSMKGWPAGIYLLYLQAFSGEHYTYKLFVQ